MFFVSYLSLRRASKYTPKVIPKTSQKPTLIPQCKKVYIYSICFLDYVSWNSTSKITRIAVVFIRYFIPINYNHLIPSTENILSEVLW